MSDANQTLQKVISGSTEFQYMMLARMKSDCEYFLGHGGAHPKHLYMQDLDEHVFVMKGIFEHLEVKPEWFSMEEIQSMESKMKARLH